MLLVAVAASFFLSLSHLGSELPGCGADSACAKVTSGVWGRLPGVDWPTAFLGLAWFGALLPTWLLCGGRLPRLVFGMVAMGVAGSVVLIGVMVLDRAICPWCAAVHAANLAFGGLVWAGRRRGRAGGDAERTARSGTEAGAAAVAGPGSAPAMATLLFVGLTMTGGLVVAERRVAARADAAAAAGIDATTDAVIARAGRGAEAGDGRGGAGGGDGGDGAGGTNDTGAAANPNVGRGRDNDRETGGDLGPGAGVAAAANPGDIMWHGTPAASVAPAPDPEIITGRWRIGPARAAIRFVVFFDYQCDFCRRIETQISRAVKARDDVSLEVRHFPFCRDCNRVAAAAGVNPHPNACWAARAAEAAGTLGGPAAFWDMHEALFGLEPPGAFTDAQLNALVADLGYDPAAFTAAMTAATTLEPVEADVELGAALGVSRTPMVYVNGVELAGWQRAGAIDDIIARLGAADLPRQSASEAGDRPPRGRERFVSSWRSSPRLGASVLDRPADQPAPARTPATGDGPAVDVVVWTDPAIASVRTLDARLATLRQEHPGLRVAYRHYPLDPACNPGAPRDLGAGSCFAARIMAAAEVIGDPAAALRVREIVGVAPSPITDGIVRVAAAAAGLDADALRAAMSSPEVDAIVAGDVAAGRRAGLRGVPLVFVDGRRVPRLDYQDIDVLSAVVDAAAGEG
ncbi:MAG: DsbA family protein [Phycisphaerales bacterium]